LGRHFPVLVKNGEKVTEVTDESFDEIVGVLRAKSPVTLYKLLTELKYG